MNFPSLTPEGFPRNRPPAPWRPPAAVSRPSGPPGRFRDLGHLRPMLDLGLLDAFHGWAEETQDDFVVWAGPVPHVVAVRPESVRAVIAGGGDFIRNVQPTQNLFRRGMLRLEGDEWRKRRRLFATPFRAIALEDAIPVIQDETDRLIDKWKTRDGAFKPSRDLSFVMLRVLGRFLFGFEFDEDKHGGRPLHQALVTLSTNTVVRYLLGRPVAATLQARKVASAERWLDGLCREILATGRPTPFMQVLRRAIRRGELDERTALDELRGFLVAGHETSATGIAWTTALLATEAEKAQQVAAESDAAAHATSSVEVFALKQTDRWVKESLRLFPPVPMSVSQAARDTQLGDIRVPAGTRIDVSSYVSHRLSSNWEDAESFEPDRFETTPDPGIYYPFLTGPHQCVGKHLAMLELPIVAARLAGAFEFELPQGPPQVNLRLSLHPAGFVAKVRPK